MKPKVLPLNRPCDHKIPTQSGHNLLLIKPYRYPYFQKAEIERLVSKMLATGIIRHSNSPYSSLVILMKKQDGS